METLYGADAIHEFKKLQNSFSNGNRNVPPPPDWFVNNTNGSVYYFKGVKNITQEIIDKYGLGANAKDLQNIGSDNMFGNKVGSDILDRNLYIVDNPKNFMEDRGYKIVENVTVKEREFVSGGAVGGENFKTITSEINQLGSTKLTYVIPSLVDQKLDIRKSKESSVYSSIATMKYNINKPVGQSLNTTAEYFGNRRPTAATIGVILTFISNFFNLQK